MTRSTHSESTTGIFITHTRTPTHTHSCRQIAEAAVVVAFASAFALL